MWYPIRSIHDEAEYKTAVKIAGALAVYDHLNEDQERYLDTITTLIEAYEDHRIPFDWPEMSSLEILKRLLDEHGMSISDFAHLIGVNHRLGLHLLSGECNLSVDHIRILADRFKVSPELFMKKA
ncbi:helix-turn-helix domain-containing protein [Candidatus Entotheonella palauensis]|uniref:helix-turn-helix domain-containing protein n=1 Tax=Candidatus Entotheonella palauensis TaxID=93172 RepID=UPI0004B57319|nr:hypothetical protein [Candidatus Entotheonella palauensis]